VAGLNDALAEEVECASQQSNGCKMALMPPDWCGWGRLSDDGPGHYNPDPSEGRPLGRRSHVLHGGARSSPRPDTVRGTVVTTRCTKGGCKPDIGQRMPGAGLSCPIIREGTAWKASLPAVLGKTRPYGMIGGIEETSASFEARSAPRFYPTGAVMATTEEPQHSALTWRGAPAVTL
jgi:hypothetical protein